MHSYVSIHMCSTGFGSELVLTDRPNKGRLR